MIEVVVVSYSQNKKLVCKTYYTDTVLYKRAFLPLYLLNGIVDYPGKELFGKEDGFVLGLYLLPGLIPEL